MRALSVPVVCTGWAAITMIVALTVPALPGRAAFCTAGAALLIGGCAAAGRAMFQHAACTLRDILCDELAVGPDQPTPWVELVAQDRTVALRPGGERLAYPGVTIRSGIGSSVVEQRWLPYGETATDEDDERLIAGLQATCRWTKPKERSRGKT
jgi:hypothetical protein